MAREGAKRKRAAPKRAAPERAAPERAVQGDQKVPYSPACPGIVKTRPQSPLSRLPPGSNVFEAFANVRADKDLSDEEAFLEFLTTYDVPLSALSRIYGSPPFSLIKATLCLHNYSWEARGFLLECYLRTSCTVCMAESKRRWTRHADPRCIPCTNSQGHVWRDH